MRTFGMKTAIAALIAVSGLRAEELTDPVEILKKADEACKKLEAVSYDAVSKGRLPDGKEMPTVTGSVTMVGFSNGRPQKYLVKAKVQRPDSAEVREIIAATDSDKFILIDSATKKMHEDLDPAVMGYHRGDLGRLQMVEYVHESPFTDEINGEKKELKESAKVGNEDCYQVYVKYSNPSQEAIWFISKKDFLPRKVERKRTTPAGETFSTELTVAHLNPSPKLDDAMFRPPLPEGYTKTDDFAPSRPPTQP